MKKRNKKPTKADILKVPGKSLLNLKHQIFAHKNTKRKKTRQTRKDQALEDQLEKD